MITLNERRIDDPDGAYTDVHAIRRAAEYEAWAHLKSTLGAGDCERAADMAEDLLAAGGGSGVVKGSRPFEYGSNAGGTMTCPIRVRIGVEEP